MGLLRLGLDWHLLYLMRRMDFRSKWRTWIKESISSATFSILINGSPKGFFPAERGLGQGDPLSSFLFVIIGEALSRMLSKAEACNLIHGFKPSQNAPSVSHLQYLDDTLLFCDADEDQIKNLVAILRCFKAVSGLRINFSKSSILGVSIEDISLHHYATILGCRVDSFPSTYLGVPLCLDRVP